MQDAHTEPFDVTDNGRSFLRKQPRHLDAQASRDARYECRLSSLKVLAMTLLTEIESIENGSNEQDQNLGLQAQVQRFEAELIRSALQKTRGRQRKAAKLLGMKVTTLNTKIRRYGLEANSRNRKADEVAGEH